MAPDCGDVDHMHFQSHHNLKILIDRFEKLIQSGKKYLYPDLEFGESAHNVNERVYTIDPLLIGLHKGWSSTSWIQLRADIPEKNDVLSDHEDLLKSDITCTKEQMLYVVSLQGGTFFRFTLNLNLS